MRGAFKRRPARAHVGSAFRAQRQRIGTDSCSVRQCCACDREEQQEECLSAVAQSSVSCVLQMYDKVFANILCGVCKYFVTHL